MPSPTTNTLEHQLLNLVSSFKRTLFKCYNSLVNHIAFSTVSKHCSLLKNACYLHSSPHKPSTEDLSRTLLLTVLQDVHALHAALHIHVCITEFQNEMHTIILDPFKGCMLDALKQQNNLLNNNLLNDLAWVSLCFYELLTIPDSFLIYSILFAECFL